MRSDRLSLFSYFGGKARFCKEIAELIDYRHTDLYIEPFGGAASVLLNKPTHGTEIYSDVSRGLVALIGCLSNPDKAPELIDRLYDTVYSEDCFLEHMAYRNSVDDNFKEAQPEATEQMAFFKKIIRRIKKTDVYKESISAGERLTDEQLWTLLNDSRILSKKDIRIADKFANGKFANILQGLKYPDANEDIGAIEPPDEMDLAVATYVTYAMSRDGMGTAFSSAKYRSSEAYYRQIDRLYDVAERLKGVQVTGAVGALSYLLSIKNSYLKDGRVMLYIDAPYLSADESEKNLGICYKGQMEVADHELLLKTITNSDAHFLISNYDTPIYNEYLRDWTKVTIETVTGVGSKKNNRRTECLWYN